MASKKIIVEGVGGVKLSTENGYENWLKRKGVGCLLDGDSDEVGDFASLVDGGKYTLGQPQQQQQQQQQHDEVPVDLLSRLIPDQEDESRRKSLEAEKKEDIPVVNVTNRDVLGTYLKFVNREQSINELMMHTAEQYYMFLNGIEENQLQYAACSGGPGLGKTTFCCKAFTRAADVPDTEDKIWENVPDKDKFYPVVKACVNAGRQYRISYGGALPLTDLDVKYPATSFARRIVMQCVAKNKNVDFPTVEGTDQLESVIHRITGQKRETLVVINIDETNKLMEHDGGSQYLRRVLTAVLEINKKRKGFVFCILSGTNVRPLHDLIYSSSSNAPKEIPLPLLEVEHMNDVLFDLAHRGQEASDHRSEKLEFVLKVLGGVPRYIEMLVYCLGEDVDSRQFTIGAYRGALESMDISPHHLLERVKDAMNTQYGQEFSEIVAAVPCDVVVAFSLFRWPVARNYKFGSHEVGELEKRGIVFLHQTRVEERHSVVFPLILLLNFAQFAVRENAPMLLQKFDVMLSPDENERNSLAILALKCTALRTMKQPATLQTLFPLNVFPNISADIRKIEMSFDCFEVREAGARVIKNSWDQWWQKLGKAGCFLVNCKGASFADMIIVSKGGTFVIFLQEKQREVAKRQAAKKQKVPMASYGMVENEHKKCNVETPHLFVLITDEDFSDRGSLKDNEIVLSYREHSIAIGPLLALLRKYNHNYRRTITINE